MKRNGQANAELIAIAAVVLIVVGIIGFLLFNPIYFVNSGEKAVIKRLGVVGTEIINEGMHFKTPWIEDAIKVNVRPMNRAEEAQAYTKDNQPIDIKYSVIYTNPSQDISDTIIKYSGSPYDVFARVKIQDAIKAVAGKYTASEFVTSREQVRKDLVIIAKQVVINEQNQKPAILVMDTPITNVDFDDQYEAAIKEKQVMQQTAQKKEYEYQAAQRDAQITVAKAKAEAEALTITAQAIAKNPSIVKLEEVKKWDGHYPLGARVIGGGATIVDAKE